MHREKREKRERGEEPADHNLFSKIHQTASDSVKLIGMTLFAVAVLTIIFVVLLTNASKGYDSPKARVADGGRNEYSVAENRQKKQGLPDLKTDILPPPIDIHGPKGLLFGASQGEFISKLAQTTKGDGSLRHIKIDGRQLPQEFVQQAMFDNADFAPHTDQFSLSARGLSTDTTKQRQRDFFGAK
jgi:hypothetical protein